MSRSAVCLFLLSLLIARPLSAQLTDEQARKAISRGAEFLKSIQSATGRWTEPTATPPGGVTGLCTLALLNAGEDPSSPAIQKALSHLRSLGDPSTVYVTSLQTMVFSIAEPTKDMALIARNVRWLEDTQLKDGLRKGAWGYAPGKGNGDNSNTQFALLALHEAERAGVTVKPETWKLALDYWLRTQRQDGSWGYQEGDPSTGSMTCAGIASVIICSGELNRGDAQVRDGSVQCCGAQSENDVVERALKWLGNAFSSARNPGSSSYWYYYLYGVERVGRMSGRRFIGEHDWFREGAEQLISRQDAITGAWSGGGFAEGAPVVATPLALLFLSKGRRPILMSKVRHTDTQDWDHHRSSVQHLTNRVERRWKRDLTWQTIDVRLASVEDLLESPVLFFSGRDGLNLTAADEERLKQFVSRGGFIFAEAACGGADFDRDFRALMKRLFPDSALRLLPPDHAIWYAEQSVDPNFVKPLYGIDACCRTSVVYCPEDLSCYWELHRGIREMPYPDPIKREVEAAIRIGANVLTYATNRELRNKLDRPQIAARSGNTEQLERGTLYLPKLAHGGGSDDAPNALPNMLEFLRTQAKMRVIVDNRLITATDESLFDYPILFLHGRRGFRFAPDERKALATFVERGGVIFADSICASPQFTESFRREMDAIFPGNPLTRIPPEHPMFTNEFRGFEIPKVKLRDPQARSEEDPLLANVSQVSPVLEGILFDDRIGVILSPFDLSCAMENGASLECKGYVKEDAAKLAANIILFALQQ